MNVGSVLQTEIDARLIEIAVLEAVQDQLVHEKDVVREEKKNVQQRRNRLEFTLDV